MEAFGAGAFKAAFEAGTEASTRKDVFCFLIERVTLDVGSRLPREDSRRA